MKQLKIALDMGDPPTVIRCKLYFSLSLMQTGYLRQAKHIIRSADSAHLLAFLIEHNLVLVLSQGYETVDGGGSIRAIPFKIVERETGKFF